MNSDEQQTDRIHDDSLKLTFVEFFSERRNAKTCNVERDHWKPIMPLFCPTCRNMMSKKDEYFLLHKSMCCQCCLWWEDNYSLKPNDLLQQRVTKFLSHLKMRQETIDGKYEQQLNSLS